MKTKRVLVTGASGFVGRPLVVALVRAGYTVRAATRRPASFPDLVESVTVPDFIYPIDWSPFLQSVDIVVHLAGLAHSRNPDTDYSEFDQINRIATQRLANAAKSVGVDALSIFHRCAHKQALPRRGPCANRMSLRRQINMAAQSLPPNGQYRRSCPLRSLDLS
jgi:NAD(P)-dependent dehydrogenase (short-subunit alcohol dehydrogenase family)